MTSPTAAASDTPIAKPQASSVVPLRRVDGMPAAPVGEAWHGPMGEYARIVDPYTEADPVAILTQGLVLFGSMIGRTAHFEINATRHHTNEFMILIGPTSTGRKGTVLAIVKHLFDGLDTLFDRRITSGLVSGEGLIWAIRDPDEENAGGTTDKRLLNTETEFASILKVAKRGESTVTEMIRRCWDGETLETKSKTAPAIATEPHVSIIGHITPDELLRNVETTEIANGFLNRLMHVGSHSDKVLPFPPSMRELEPEIGEIRNHVTAAVQHARARGPMTLSGDARPVYEAFYRAVRTNDTAGSLGQVTARSAPHVLRLALLYALLDRGDEVDVVHVEAALALWRYCWSTARWVYGFSLGDPVADELWKAMSVRPEGMTRTEIRDWFSRNKRRSEIDRALQLVQDAGLLRRLKETPTGGGPTIERYVPSMADKDRAHGRRGQNVEPITFTPISSGGR